MSKNECESTPAQKIVNALKRKISRLFSIECGSSTGGCRANCAGLRAQSSMFMGLARFRQCPCGCERAHVQRIVRGSRCAKVIGIRCLRGGETKLKTARLKACPAQKTLCP